MNRGSYKVFAVIFWLLALCVSAAAQGCGEQNPNCIVPTRPLGDSTNAAASTEFVQKNSGGGNAITSLTGDVTATGPGSAAATIQPGAVTSAKMATGAAVTNVGTLGGSLSGTLPNPSIASGAVANSNLANMAAGTVKGNNTGSTGAPLDLTGLQAEGVLQFLATGTGAAQRSVDGKLKDWVSALDFAKGDCSTDDSTAIQNAINSLTNGGTVYFPPAPGGCYAIKTATAITLPSGVAVTLLGAGRGDGVGSAGTVLQAQAVLSGGVINSGTSFIRGHRISNMTILGNAQAAYCLKMDQVDASTFDNLNLYDCTTINFRLGDGTHSTQENTVFAVRLDNPLTSVLANLPTYNLEVNGTNNNILHVKASNAKTANVHSGSTSSNNTYIAVHGYDFFSGAAQAPTNNILIDGSGEQIVSWEGDGSSSANVQINGFNNIVSNGVSQFGSPLTAHIGVQFATATCGNNVNNNQFANSTTANTIVQAGTPCNPGNFYNGNNANTQGTVIGSRLTNTIAPTLTAGCTGTGASIDAGASKYSGRVHSTTAAATTCTITFGGGGFASTPRCTVSGEVVVATGVPSTTTLVANFASTASQIWDYTCDGN